MFRRISSTLAAGAMALSGLGLATVGAAPAEAATCAGSNGTSLSAPPTMSNPDGVYKVKMDSCSAKKLYDVYPANSDAVEAVAKKGGWPGGVIALANKSMNQLSQKEIKGSSEGFTRGIECTMSSGGWVGGCKPQ